ncbi:MAG TPA: XDD4 family exosortase-dependent surface protein [Albitalea sp.]|nr:XDD4 family exosortase-dependent surface protein [Albitalea sp.]
MTHFTKASALRAPVIAAALACAAMAAQATTQTFATASTNPAASATFVTGANSIGITLTNTLATPIVSAGQELTGLNFDVLGLPSISGSVNFTSGDLISIQGGVLVDLADTTAAGAAAWNLSFTGGHMLLTALAGSVGHNGPDDGIIPFATSYPSANPSLTGSTHNPLFRGPVTFTLTGVANVTAHSYIDDDSVVFRFNTDGATTRTGYCTSRDCEPPVPSVPEPETYALMLAGLGIMAFLARRRSSND